MSKQGLEAAKQPGEALPSFTSLENAASFYFAFRDDHLLILTRITAEQNDFTADFSPGSLKQIEAWYFKLCESNSFEGHKTNRATFERCLAMYFCEVVVRTFPNATWVVEESVFSPGKYELGVRKGLCTYMLTRFTDHYKESNNKRRQSIYRLFNKYFGQP
ncbi:MAG TPA: hypothetical protein PLD20_18420 [Blastocatellia bacterium]|nr:hypothetical protein [Blastocatellia bacterium]HMV87840.1 hypothetical protein [Blastocatellia bacterium]HMX30278.1 hypothetical protein [Blastocatellia bacterium]HMY71578.1 hypothetical protein [Blastocatellia bacterium]HMZ19918.1 hypothetical protein [Blastocatellia bacterium]